MKLTISGSVDEIKRFINGDASAKVRVDGAELLAESKPKFNVGDKVRVIGNGSQGIHHFRSIGAIGTVEKYKTEYSGRKVEAYYVDFGSEFAPQTVAVEDLELVVETPKLTRAVVVAPTRHEIVARAKRDVAELKNTNGDGHHYSVIKPKSTKPVYCYADFIVNRDKRTVVALLYGWFSGEIYAKGIAKCAPDDVFNADIGKAIALRRALGLDVPTEYLHAPKPEGVAVGDVVQTTDDSIFVNIPYKVDKIDDECAYDKPGNGWIPTKFVKVIDDTDRSEYKADAV